MMIYKALPLLLVCLRRCCSGAFSEPRQMTISKLTPPRAQKIPHNIFFGKVPGEDRGENAMDPPLSLVDMYHWLRDKPPHVKPGILQYLNEENAYCTQLTEQLGITKIKEEINEELLSHYKEDDASVPNPSDDWFYFTRLKKGEGYPTYSRSKRTVTGASPKPYKLDEEFIQFSAETGVPSGKEFLLFDVNEMAKGKPYFDFGGFEPSPDHSIMAYASDLIGDEIYNINFINFGAQNPKLITDTIIGVSSNVVWDNEGKFLFYLGLTVERRRFKLFVHKMGTSQSCDVCLYEEVDKEFDIYISKSSSRQFLYLVSEASETTDFYLLNLADFAETVEENGFDDELKRLLVQVTPRVEGHKYNLDHHDDKLFIITDKDNSTEKKLCAVSLNALPSDKNAWQDIFSYSKEFHYIDIQSFKDHLVLSCRVRGQLTVWIASIVGLNEQLSNDNACQILSIENNSFTKKIKIGDEILTSVKLSSGANNNFETSIIRIEVNSYTSPTKIIEFRMSQHGYSVLRKLKVPNYWPEDYHSERIMIPSHDGVEIPISLIYSKTIFQNGIHQLKHPVPLILEGYGSYGISKDPKFNFRRIPLLKRGFIYAEAHVRGGGDMGYYWYKESGKFLNKKNTFYDFIACAQALQYRGMTTPKLTAIIGRSAGGLLVGASVNISPDSFGAVIANVPFVDVLNTMSDSTIPLTTGEWVEWGNPNQEGFFQYIKEYSPYENVAATNYPHMLVTAGLNDPRVSYWEPAKWVAKLRDLKIDHNLLLFKTDMTSGHFSASDRYANIKEYALEQAFLLYVFTLNDTCV